MIILNLTCMDLTWIVYNVRCSKRMFVQPVWSQRTMVHPTVEQLQMLVQTRLGGHPLREQ